jgi:hypothetical protein
LFAEFLFSPFFCASLLSRHHTAAHYCHGVRLGSEAVTGNCYAVPAWS